MIPGISGSLLSEEALQQRVPDALRGLLDDEGRGAARRQLAAWHTPLRAVLGPSAGVRTIFDRLALPLFARLGYRVVPDAMHARSALSLLRAWLEVRGRPPATLLVTGWGHDPGAAWRDAIRAGIGHRLR